MFRSNYRKVASINASCLKAHLTIDILISNKTYIEHSVTKLTSTFWLTKSVWTSNSTGHRSLHPNFRKLKHVLMLKV